MACNNTLLSITLCIPDIRVYQLMTLMCIICIRISIRIHFVYTGKCRIFYSATYWCFFDEMQDTEHHYEKLPLSELHTGMVSQSVLDYMHLICLRVVARLIWQWTTGPVWVPAGLVSDTSCWLIEAMCTQTSVIVILSVRKGQEDSTIVRPIVLNGKLSDAAHQNFMLDADCRIVTTNLK